MPFPALSFAGSGTWHHMPTENLPPSLQSRYAANSAAHQPPRTRDCPFDKTDLPSRHFQPFCHLYDITPWSASELTLRYYCVHAYHSLSHATILVYLAAFRHQHLLLGYRDPLVGKPLLMYLCKGIKRRQGTKGRVKLPLTAAQLAIIQQSLRHCHEYPRQEGHLGSSHSGISRLLKSC